MRNRLYLTAFCLILSPGLYAAPPLDRINSDLPEYGLVKGPDGYYFSRSSSAFGKPGKEQILRVPLQGGLDESPEWTDTDYSEGDTYFSPDGQSLCFVSDRPSDDDPHPGDHDIWCAQRDGDAWQSPQRMPEPVNSAATEFSPVLANDGSLYFASDRPGGLGQGDLYQANPTSDGGWNVENLGPKVNSAQGEWNLELSLDGQLLIFEASQRSSNRSIPGDLYFSEKTDGGWTPGIPLSTLNTRGSELMPRFLSLTELSYASSFEGDAIIKLVELEDIRPVPGLLAAMSRSAHELVLLDPQTLSVRQRIAVGTGPHEIASSSDGRKAVVVSHGVFPQPHEQPIQPSEMRWQSADSEGFVVLDLATGEARKFSLDDCLRPHGIAVTPQADRAWITCEDLGEIREVSTTDGMLLNRTGLTKGVHKLMYLEQSGVLVASNPETGEAYLLDVNKGSVLVSITTGKGAEALAASRDEQTVWVANGFEPSVCKISLAERSLKTCWPSGGKFPIALAVDESRQLLWVARSASSDVVALSLEDLTPIHEYTLASTPLGMVLDEQQGRLYLTLPRLNEVIVLDVNTGEVTARAEGVMEADDLDLIPGARFNQAPDT